MMRHSHLANSTVAASPAAFARCGQTHRCQSSSRRRGAHSSISCRATPTSTAGPRQCVVLGGGVGGLVTAAKLAQQPDINVTVIEQQETVGGRLQTVLSSDGYRWDTGPSLLLLPQVYKQTFEWLGARLDDYVQLRRVEPAAYRVWLAGSDSGGGGAATATVPYLDLLYDVQQMVQQLEQVQPGAGQAYLDWLAEARRALVVGTREFIARDFQSVAEFLDLRRLLPLLGEVDVAELLGPHHSRLMRRFQNNPQIAAMLSFQDLYVGLSPYSAPGVFSLLAATELTDGVFYPLQGFSKVTDGLVSICRQHGVQIKTGAAVKAIRSRDGAVTGVELQDGTFIQADLVVTNRDVSMSHGLCVDEPRMLSKQEQLAAKGEFSAGVIAYYFAVSRRCPQLVHHNVFLSRDYQASWQRAREPGQFVRHPNFYLCCPSRTDPTAAPPGGDSIMVLLPVANIQQRAGDADYAALVAAGRQLVFDTLAAAGVDLRPQDIVREEVQEPQQWREMYGLEHGAAFGLSHGLNQLALFRPACVDPDAPRGLYHVGASSRPGNGVPLVMLGARLTVDRILADMTAST